MYKDILKKIFYECDSLLKKYNYDFTKFYNVSRVQSGGGLEVTYKKQKVKFYKIAYDDVTTIYLSNKDNRNNRCITIILYKDDDKALIHELTSNPNDSCQLPDILNKGSSHMDIAMKLIIQNKEKWGIKTVHITDNSFIYCDGINISLAELSFLQYGSTFYGRWGFKPKLKQQIEEYELSQEKIFKFRVKDINLEKFIKKKYKKEISKKINKIIKSYKDNQEDNFVNWFKDISRKCLKKECNFFNKLIRYVIRRFDLDIFPRYTFIKEL